MLVTWICPWCGVGPQALHIEDPHAIGCQPMVLAHCSIEDGGCDTASAISVKITARADVHAIELQPHTGKARMPRDDFPRGDYPDNWSRGKDNPV